MNGRHQIDVVVVDAPLFFISLPPVHLKSSFGRRRTQLNQLNLVAVLLFVLRLARSAYRLALACARR